MAKSFFLLTLLLVLFISTIASAQQEEITLSTYYPAPFGEYDELCAEKLLVSLPSAAELQDMARGDCHITRSLIVGSGAGTGFSYDELEGIGSLPANGDLLIMGNVGIGTPEPDGVFHIERDGAAGTTLLHLTGNSEEYAGLRVRIGAGNAAGAQDYFEITGRPSYAAGVGSGGDIRILRWHNPYFTNTGDLWLMPDGGNVGIGTTSPTTTLEIQAATPGLRIRPTLDSRDANIYLYTTQTAADREWRIMAGTGGASPNTNFRIYDNTAAADRLNINSAGNVGIGTTSPQAKLHVGGVAGTDGIMFPDGSLQNRAAKIYSCIGATDISVDSASWTTMPNTTLQIPSDFKGGDIYVHFNAAIRKRGWMWIRLVLDIGTGSEQVLIQTPRTDLMSGANYGTYGYAGGPPVSLTYVRQDLSSGAHTITAQWRGNLSQDGVLSSRVMTVIAGD